MLDLQYMAESLPKIAAGIPVSLCIALVAFVFGIVIGFVVALIKIRALPGLSQAAAVYVSFMRGTPLLVQIFLAYYGMPMALRYFSDAFGWSLDISGVPAIAFMYVTFSLNVGAYLSESIRASILSVDKGQADAASSIGMSPVQAMIHVIIPQAAMVAIPNLGNSFIALLKDTSLAFSASVAEIMGMAKITAARSSKFLEAYIIAAALYWIICIVLERLLACLEGKLRKHEQKRLA